MPHPIFARTERDKTRDVPSRLTGTSNESFFQIFFGAETNLCLRHGAFDIHGAES